ncbi:MAG: hypothetical protein A2017_19505 [Lentisphaerae bacterium GWF2_44_16]|nr:MAG: hypothetical protein A2017_19505 [Lentisphaerae bacterium GWF2_44_16]HAU66525.1 hypothetical protein [Candidatus Uhrbacteria bacterium]
MALADRLFRKVTERQEEEAKKLEETRAAELQAEVSRKEKLEKSRLVNLRRSIESIDSKVSHMRDLFTELTQAHERAGTSVAGAKKEGKALKTATTELERVFQDETFRLILADEGINSFDDLLNAEDYSKESEVKAVKESRQSRTTKRQTAQESITARHEVKERVREALRLETRDPGRLTYKDIIATLKGFIETLEQERKKLFDQTPEGQETIRAEIFDRVKQQYGQRWSYNGLAFIKQRLDRQPIIVEADLEDAHEHGEEEVKAVIKEYYEQVIDRDLQEEAERNGLLSLKEAVRTIENLSVDWNNIRKTLAGVQRARIQTIDQLVKLLGSDKKSELFQRIKRYGNWNHDDPERLAEAFVDTFAKENAMMFGLGDGSQIPEMIIEKEILNQERLLQHVHDGDSKKVFSRTDVDLFRSSPFDTKLENPERIGIILTEQEEFYKKFQRILSTSEELLEKMKQDTTDIFEEVHVRSRHDLGIDGRGVISLMVSFDGKTYLALRESRFESVKVHLEREQKKLEQKRTQLKAQLNDKVEADWDEEQLQTFRFRNNNDSLVREAESRMDFKETAEQLSSKLDMAMVPMTEFFFQEVVLNQYGRIEFSMVPEKDFEDLDRKIESLSAEIKRKKKVIEALKEEILENNGFFQKGRRRKIEAEKQTLEDDLVSLEEGFKTLREENERKRDLDRVLKNIRTILKQVAISGLKVSMPRTKVPLHEFIDTVKKQLIIELTPAQSSVLEQYQALVKKRDETKEVYKRKWLSSFRPL